MTAHCQTECLGCIVASTVARVNPGVPVACREADCGAEFTFTPQSSTAKREPAAPAPAPAPARKREARRSLRLAHNNTESGALRLVQAFVADVLDWTRTRERVDRVAYGGESQFESIARVLRAGVIGSGNSGTKGVGTTSNTPRMAKGDAATDLLYAQLSRPSQHTVDAVVQDGRGLVLSQVVLLGKALEWPLEARIGVLLASEQQRLAWARKALEGDSWPPLDASSTSGDAALRTAAREWMELRAKARGES